MVVVMLMLVVMAAAALYAVVVVMMVLVLMLSVSLGSHCHQPALKSDWVDIAFRICSPVKLF